MKKLFYSMFALAMTAMTFTSCEDVPMPYNDPNNVDPGTIVVPADPTGTGTAADPFNVSAANKYIEEGGDATVNVYVKGIISSIKSIDTSSFGNAEYYISDDGTANNQFYVYRGYALNNTKFTSEDQIKLGDEVVICGKLVNYNGTYEFAQGNYIVSLNGEGTAPAGPGNPSGDGTAASPFNADGVIQYINSLGSDVESSTDVYIKGKVVAITEQYGTQFGNATFTISDDGTASTTQFQVYRALYLGNKKYTSGDLLKEKDDVIICGKVVNFRGNTPETVTGKAYLYSLNGKTADGGGSTPGGQPSGDGTQANPYNPAAAIAAVSGLTWTSNTEYQKTEDVYVKGKVSRIANKGTFSESGDFGNASFWISEDGKEANEFYCYRILYLENKKYTGGTDVQVGDDVVICGKLMNYRGNTPETVAGEAYLYSIKSNGGGSGGNTGGGTSGEVLTSLVNGNFESWSGGLPTGWKSASTASSATLSQSSDAHGGNYSVNVNGKESSNVRLATQEIKLAAGTYVFSFWAKATTADAAQARPGFVPVDNGSVGSYSYGDYVNLTTGWKQFSHEFTLSAETTICLVVMNPKKSTYSSGKDILIDDATLTKK